MPSIPRVLHKQVPNFQAARLDAPLGTRVPHGQENAMINKPLQQPAKFYSLLSSTGRGGKPLFVTELVALARDLHSFRRQIGAVEVNPAIGRPTGRALAFLGQRLFYDVRLSRSGLTACASCHDPGFGFALPSRVTVSDDGRVGKRNAPALVDSGLQATLMWDGRFRSLEQQALSPFRRGEMGIGVDEAVSRLNSDREYVRAFMTSLDDGRLQRAWQRLSLGTNARLSREPVASTGSCLLMTRHC